MLRLCPRCHKEMELEKIQRVVEPGKVRVVHYWRCMHCFFRLEDEVVYVGREVRKSKAWLIPAEAR
jgi:C4-type Zn-finger protein